jgi:CheY-like chemotaxis protein
MDTPPNVETILVVDDHHALCELIEVILTRVGYQVLLAASATEALDRARVTPRIDLLVTDWELPGMRGDELANCFARLHPSAAIVFISSWTGPFKTDEPHEYLAKPFTVAKLRETVRTALEKQARIATTAAQRAIEWPRSFTGEFEPQG